MLENLSYTITVLLALSAIFSPIFTALINNQHQKEINKQNNELQIKLKHLDFYNTHKDVAISEYLNSLCEYINVQTPQTFAKYSAASAKACMYVSSKACNAIDEINIHIKYKHFNKALETMTENLAYGLFVENEENRVKCK